MLTRRIIPCLDVAGGRVVKGINFRDLRDAGDPVHQAEIYSDEGADEIAFLDITATVEGRDTIRRVVERVAERVMIPLTVGGGIRGEEDAAAVLLAGADKVGINSAAVRTPRIVTALSERFGAQCVVAAIDAKRRADGSGWEVFIDAGRTPTGREAVGWSEEAVRLGAGEILLTSMDCDGTLSGYDIELLRRVSSAVPVPVVASGGAGELEHLHQALAEGKADAVLAASIFHYGTFTIRQAKEYLRGRGVPVRL